MSSSHRNQKIQSLCASGARHSGLRTEDLSFYRPTIIRLSSELPKSSSGGMICSSTAMSAYSNRMLLDATAKPFHCATVINHPIEMSVLMHWPVITPQILADLSKELVMIWSTSLLMISKSEASIAKSTILRSYSLSCLSGD